MSVLLQRRNYFLHDALPVAGADPAAAKVGHQQWNMHDPLRECPPEQPFVVHADFEIRIEHSILLEI